jgi:UDP-N-acetyl-D-mannosaminuronic acid dehydrogenase
MLRAIRKPEPAEVFIIAVPTPFKEGKAPDLSYVEEAARRIAPVSSRGNLVILESTSPVGTTERLAAFLAASRPDLRFPQRGSSDEDVAIAHCPERVLPGRILRELIDNHRIIGGLSAESSQRAADFYALFVQGERILTDAPTAELCKLTENAFRDVNIAFANEVSRIAGRLGIDVWELIRLANRHPRVNILKPGPGVGGHCISVDPWFIVDSALEEARPIRLARDINDGQPERVVQQVIAAAAPFERPVIACLGLTYKPDIDDLRESPALEITVRLAGLGLGSILVVEPHLAELPADLIATGVALNLPVGCHQPG